MAEHFAFLIKRKCDREAWATIYSDRARAVGCNDRVSAVVRVTLVEFARGDACLAETVDGRPLERCKEYPRCVCGGPDEWEEGMGGDAVLDRNVS